MDAKLQLRIQRYGWDAAAALYDDAWRAGIRERLGAEPSITYFESPVIVDNALGSISTAA